MRKKKNQKNLKQLTKQPMSKEKETVKEVKVLPSLACENKNCRIPTLRLSKEIQNQIDYCHSIVGNKEWSGTLIYSFENAKFSIKDLYLEDDTEIVINAEKFLVRDVGTGGSTEFELSNEEMFEQMEYIEAGKRAGLIHTHHNMGAYFSGVDDTELKTNAPNNEIYLSLVVDFQCKPKARLCWNAEIETVMKTNYKFSFLNKITNRKSETTEIQKIVCYVDLDVEFDVDEDLKTKLDSIIESKKPVVRNYYQGHLPFTGITNNYSNKEIGKSNEAGVTVRIVKENYKKKISDVVTEMNKAGVVSSLKFDHDTVTSFLAKWFSFDYNTKKTCWQLFNDAKLITDKDILDTKEDLLAASFEEVFDNHFNEVPTNYEILILSYRIKEVLQHHKDNLAIDRLISVVNDIIDCEIDLLNEPEEEEYDCVSCGNTGLHWGAPCAQCDKGLTINDEWFAAMD